MDQPKRRTWSSVGTGLLVVIIAGSGLYVGGLIVANQAAPESLKVHRPVTEADRNRKGEDWPQFLGPKETGVSNETDLLLDWPADGPPIIWERSVGTGYSAPSIRGEKLVLHHRVRDEEIVQCFRADDGSEIWDHRYATTYSDPYGYNNGPRCTPLLTENRCYTFGAEGVLCCVDLKTGQEIWTRRTKDEFDMPPWFFGIGCTPVLDDGLLIAIVGGQPNSGVVAFDAETGKTVWEAVGKDTWDQASTGWEFTPTYEWTGEEKVASYSSPIVATIHGRRHLLCLMRHGLVSLDPKTGKEHFKYWFRSRIGDSVNAARPVVIGDKIFLSAAYRVGSALIQVQKDGTSIKELWSDSRNMLNHWSTSIHVDGYVYGFSGRHEQEGELRCLELETGRVVWATDGTDAVRDSVEFNPATNKFIDRTTRKEVPFPFYGRGSKIQIGDHFIALGERGTLALVKVDPQQFQELARASYKQIHYPAWTAPVLSRKRLYLRCEDALLCLDLARPESE